MMYLISCHGMGDSHYAVVDKETWDWVNSNEENMPQSIFDKFSQEEREWRGRKPTFTRVSGTFWNDKALAAPPIIVDGEEALFFSAGELVSFLNRTGINILDEFEGGIY